MGEKQDANKPNYNLAGNGRKETERLSRNLDLVEVF